MVRYLSPIDPHVHLRWNEYPNHDFMQWGFDDARAVGLRAVIEQPNTEPALTTFETISERIKLVDRFRRNVVHAIHIGLTPNLHQQRTAMALVMLRGDVLDRIVSTKTFYVRSTKSGEIEIVDPDYQKYSWENKARFRYEGPDVGHFEDGELFVEKFDPNNPKTHSLRQSPEAEVSQVDRQLNFAHESGYRGRIVILHTSTYDTIDFVDDFNKRVNPDFKVYFEVTPHHMFLNSDEDYDFMQKHYGNGNLVKMNPPLRTREIQERLLHYVLQGRVDIIGTDHAPHPIERKKDSLNPASGIQGKPIWPFVVRRLYEEDIRQKILDNLIFHNSNNIYFHGRLKPRTVEVEYNPTLWEKYGFNPFSRIDETLK